ncbi:TetR/AcrR family transcriptional regulator [Barrientosiimonas marina]|uniref:TetR/AcrR family transcriptional regulator n=1 Tax=Lentibacillus kimchii TaxID=1542911 RepID=A0ABW2UX48_9BACI
MEFYETNRDKQAMETKKRVIEAARHIFLKNGFDKTTISQIIKEAGVGYGTAYVYFKNKDDIFVTVMEDVMAKFLKVAHQTFYPQSKEEAVEQIRSQVTDYMALAVDERAILKIVNEAIGLSDMIASKWSEIQHKFIDGITADITYSQSRQLANSAFDPAITAKSWYAMNETFMWHFVASQDQELKPIVDQLTLFYMSALYEE